MVSWIDKIDHLWCKDPATATVNANIAAHIHPVCPDLSKHQIIYPNSRHCWADWELIYPPVKRRDIQQSFTTIEPAAWWVFRYSASWSALQKVSCGAAFEPESGSYCKSAKVTDMVLVLTRALQACVRKLGCQYFSVLICRQIVRKVLYRGGVVRRRIIWQMPYPCFFRQFIWWAVCK